MLAAAKYFFEILVYPGTSESLETFLARRRNRWVAPLAAVKDHYPRTYAHALKAFDRRRGYPVRFNDTVGAIGLHVRRRRVCAELHFSTAQRIQRGGHHRILESGPLFRTPPFNGEPRRMIYEAVRDRLLEAMKASPLDCRWVDCRAFEQLGPHLDWRQLLHLPARSRAD